MIRKELIELYFTNRERNDRAFWYATGGNGNQQERQERMGTDEIPLLKKMTEEELNIVSTDKRSTRDDKMIISFILKDREKQEIFPSNNFKTCGQKEKKEDDTKRID